MAAAGDEFAGPEPSLERAFRGHRGGVAGLAFNPNMRQLVSAGLDGDVLVWNFKPSLRAYRFAGHTASVHSVAFSEANGLIASGSKDRTVRLWLPTAEGRSSVLKGHVGAVRAVNFSPDGRLLLSASDDKTVKLWTLPKQRFAATLAGHGNWVRSAAFSPDGRTIASGGDDKVVKLWDAETQKCVASHEQFGLVYSVAFSPDECGACVATGASDGTMRVLDTRVAGGAALIQAHTAPSPASAPRRAAVHALSWHPAGSLVLGACADAALRLWDVRAGALAFTCHGHAAESGERTHSASGALAASFSPAGDFFASGGADAQLLVWRTRCDEPLAPAGGGPPIPLRRSFVRPHTTAPRPPVPPPQHVSEAPPRVTVRRAPPPPPSPQPQPRSYLPARTPPPPRPHAPSPPDDGDAGGPAAVAATLPGAFASAALADSFQAASVAAAEYAQRLAASGRPAPARAPSPRAVSPGGAGDAAGGDVSAALARVAAQLEVLSNTVAILDERLSLQEARTGRALQQGLL